MVNPKTHSRVVHEGQRNYKCDYCEKSFSTSEEEEKIERVH